MPKCVDSNQLFEMFKSGEEYKIIRIISDAKELNEKYPSKMLYFILEENDMKKIQEEKDISDNIINLQEARLKLASKEPPVGGNWLSALPFETRFLASRKGMNESQLGDFLIATDPTKMPAVLLGFELNHRDGGFRWVDPVKFSRDYDYFMTLEVQHDGTKVEEGRVASDGEPEELHLDDES